MRSETAWAWILASLSVLAIGTVLYVFNVSGKLVGILTAVGFVYFVIGAVLSVMHDRHMDERTRVGRE